MKGLAYVDFLDDEHLAAAVAKNKNILLGKKLSIARSDPRRGGKKTSDAETSKEHAHASNRPGRKRSVSIETDDTFKEDVNEAKLSSRNVKGSDDVQLKGKNTFAVPRNVRPRGFDANKSKLEEEGEEKPKSNEEFRKMIIR